jgi:O-antigen/teichoic acid export membrane protein
MTGSTSKAPHEASRQRAFYDVLLQVVVRVVNLGLGVVVTALVVRMLGESGYGQWSTILVVFQMAGYFMSFGMESVAVREAARRPEEAGDWVGALVMLRLAMSLPTMLGGLLALLVIEDNATMLVAGLILLLQFPLSVGSSLQVVHHLRIRNALPMIVLTINSVVWGVAVIGIDFAGGGMVALAIAMTATTALTSSIQAFAALRLVRFQPRPSRHAMKVLLRTGIPVGIAGLLVLAYARIDQVILFEMAGSRDAGLYGAVYLVLEQAHFVPISVLTTLAPMIAAAWPADREKMLRVVRLAAEFLAIGSFGALAVAVIAAKPLTRLFFGPDFVDAAPALPVLGGAFVLICFGYLTGNLLLVLGLARRQVTVGLIALVANVVGNLLLVPRYGFMGAAWITLVTELVVVSVGLLYIALALEIRRPAIGRIGRIAVAAGSLMLILWGVRSAGGGLVGILAAAAVAYPALLFGLRALEPGELRDLLVRRRAPA